MTTQGVGHSHAQHIHYIMRFAAASRAPLEYHATTTTTHTQHYIMVPHTPLLTCASWTMLGRAGAPLVLLHAAMRSPTALGMSTLSMTCTTPAVGQQQQQQRSRAE